MKQAFITGITGFVGSTLARKLQEAGYQITAMVREASVKKVSKLGLEVHNTILCDIAELEENQDMIRNVLNSETEVFHCAALLGAAQASHSKYDRINVEATKILIELCQERKVNRFVFVSSMGAAGPNGSYEQPMTEESECSPLSYYSYSKYLAEQYLLSKEWSFPITIYRPPNIYGPGMNMKSGAAMIFTGLKKRVFAIIGNGKNYINFAYIDNVVTGIISTYQQVESGTEVFFVSDENPYQMIALVKKINELAGVSTFLIKIPYLILLPFAYLVECIGKLLRKNIGFNRELLIGSSGNGYVFSIEKIKKYGQKEFVSFDTAVQLTLEYMNNM